MAAAVRLQIEEIKTLPDRSLAYASLFQLQRLSADDPSSIEALSLCSPPLIPVLVSDIHHRDEEIASQALKCLGFMLYHPSLVPTISEGDARSVLDSLVKLVTTTRTKAVCNLGVWCISIQQFSAVVIGDRIHPLVTAVVHALDNPFGSLSTTFEGIQAVMKLATQVCDKMRETSNIWVPPAYRRLICTEKKERDMAERCMWKTKSIICPPPLTLSEIVKIDLEEKLLPRMMDLLHHDQGQKVHLIQAWGWYVSLLGSDALSNRHLVNKLLKVPEQTFTDCDPQVQIASLVVWESLIDALLPPQAIELKTEIAQGSWLQQKELAPSMTPMRPCENQTSSLVRRIKVIMLPLRRLISSKCDISVRSSCFNTWHYLLHKLDLLVNHPSVITTAFVPILEEIFSLGPDNQSICIWTSCLELLDDFVLSKVKAGVMDLPAEDNSIYLVNKMFPVGSHINAQSSWKHYPIKWLPWEISNLHLHQKFIKTIVSRGLMMTLAPESRTLACNSASRIFRSVLQGIQVELKMLSNHYDRIQFCINTIFQFTREVCDDMASETVPNQCNDLIWTALQFLKAIRDELDPSILASPLYRIRLDLHYIKMKSSENIECPLIHGLGVGSLVYMDMVSPMVYTTILHLCLVAQALLNISVINGISCVMQHSKYLIFSANPSYNLHAVICFLNMHIGEPIGRRLFWLTIWRVIGKGLKETIDSVNELSFLRTEYDSVGYTMIHLFLCYPLLLLFSPEKVSSPPSIGTCSDLSLVSSQRELELEHAIEVWKSLFDSSNNASQIMPGSTNSFTEGLCKIFVEVLDENISTLQGSVKSYLKEIPQDTVILFLFTEAAVHMLKHIQVLDAFTSESVAINQESSDYEQCSSIKNGLGLVTRFLGLLLTCAETNPQTDHLVISRVFAAMSCLVGRICLKQDILLLMEIVSDPMVQWLSLCGSMYGEMQHGSIMCELHCLWKQILDCLQRSQPPIVFDSLFLGVQAPLLQATLDHPHPSISDASIAFWKATYCQKTSLNYPQCLLPVLDKLSRTGRISLQKESPVILVNNGSWVKEDTGVSRRFTVTTTHKRILGLDIIEEPGNNNGRVNIVTMGSRTKRLKMARNQVKPSRVHEGRLNDIHVVGPREGADFSQVFEHSLENQEVRKPEYILEMLRRAR